MQPNSALPPSPDLKPRKPTCGTRPRPARHRRAAVGRGLDSERLLAPPEICHRVKTQSTMAIADPENRLDTSTQHANGAHLWNRKIGRRLNEGLCSADAYNAWARQCNRSGRTKLSSPRKEQADFNRLQKKGQAIIDERNSNFQPAQPVATPAPSYTSDAALGYPAGCTNKMKYDRCALNGTPGTGTCSLNSRFACQDMCGWACFR
jgi:hypothetical protein